MRLVSAFITVFVLSIAATSASAAPIITFMSGDGETWIGGLPIGGGAGTTVVTNAHPAWQPAALAKWVSYADTGYAGSQLTPPSGTAVVFTVSESFMVNPGSILNMTIWADDTARILVDGVQMIAPNFSQDTCAAGSLGCEPNEYGSIVNHMFLTGGLHTVALEVFQVGTGLDTRSNPFAVLYEGTVDLNSVPEPATLILFGMAAAGLARRVRRTSSASTV